MTTGGPATVDDAPIPTAVDDRPASPTQPTPSADRADRADGGGRLGGRRRLPIVMGVVLVAAAAGAALYLSSADGADPIEEPITIRAVEAEQRDLIEFVDLDGTMGYAKSSAVAAATGGTIVGIVDDGDLIERGDVVYELNGDPVVLFYGDIPLYRPLAEGDEGEDVEILEANLASLGYHTEVDDDGDEIDRDFLVDGRFDAATADAVVAWQADLGVEETGRVEPGDVVVAAGPSVASNLMVDVASVVQVGAPIMELAVTAVNSAVYSEHGGEIEVERPVDAGAITSGQVLYTVDDLPITVVVTDEPMDRRLFEGVEDGDDVQVIEEMLVALGHDAGGDLVVDDEFDEFTTEAIEDWQEDLQDRWDDVAIDGVIEPGDLIAIDAVAAERGGVVIERDGDLTASGSELLAAVTDEGSRVVTTAVDVADQEKLGRGDIVEVEFPGGSTVPGVVSEVATSSTKDPTDPNAVATLAVEITLSSIPDSASGLNEVDVEVKLVDRLAEGATVVPASALVTTADGGYAVEVVTGATTTSFVGVEPGMFADGFVEVTGIDVGTAVVVPT